MKQKLILFISIWLCLSGCKSDPTLGKITGEISGLDTDTIYLCGNDEFAYFIEPIAVKDNKFSLEIALDTTLVQTMLVIGNEEPYPVYMERGKTIHIKSDANTPGIFEVKGNATNEELTAFLQRLPQQQTTPADTLTLRLIEEYIRINQKSLINIYLLDNYFVRVPQPDYSRIKSLIAVMDGMLQDKPYIKQLTDFIDEYEKAGIDKYISSFTLTNPEGKRISRNEFRDKYLLIHFWASWSDSCDVSNEELKKIYKTYPPKEKKKKNNRKTTVPVLEDPELAIIGISLDMDKTAWKEAIGRDTLKWEQLSDFSGWSSPIVKQYAVSDIPYHILIDPRGRIIARRIRGEALEQKLDSLLNPKK